MPGLNVGVRNGAFLGKPLEEIRGMLCDNHMQSSLPQETSCLPWKVVDVRKLSSFKIFAIFRSFKVVLFETIKKFFPLLNVVIYPKMALETTHVLPAELRLD